MLGEISFAGRKAQNIKCHDTKSRVMKELEMDYKTRIIQRHYERFSESHVKRLSANPYMIALRTNGNPYLLYLTRLNFINQCIFIDKKIQQGYSAPRMIIARFNFDDSLFNGTLIDGEMVMDNDGNWMFLIGDIIALRGGYLENVNLVKRLNMLYEMFKNMYSPDVFDVCVFQIKRYFVYEEMEELLTHFVPALNYTCRGVYFKPMYHKFSDILYNFDDSLIKKVLRQKFASESKGFLEMQDLACNHTHAELIAEARGEAPAVLGGEARGEAPAVLGEAREEARATRQHLWARRTSMPDVYVLESLSNKEVGVACMPTMEASRFMRNIFKDKNINDRVEIECEQSPSFDGKWLPIGLAVQQR